MQLYKSFLVNKADRFLHNENKNIIAKNYSFNLNLKTIIMKLYLKSQKFKSVVWIDNTR